MTKDELFERGLTHISLWCAANFIKCPEVRTHSGKPDFGTCAYYRDGKIDIWVKSCAAVGLAGRSWSYPGYIVDRTPYGVLAHELGHHVERAHGPRGGILSHLWRPLDAAGITSYCPNDNEWFAELFRVFVTNPSLFWHARPKIADLFFKEWPVLIERRPWWEVLGDSERHVKAAHNKIRAAA